MLSYVTRDIPRKKNFWIGKISKRILGLTTNSTWVTSDGVDKETTYHKRHKHHKHHKHHKRHKHQMTPLHSMFAVTSFCFLFLQANSFATPVPSPKTKIQRKCFGYGSQFPLKQSSDDNDVVASKIPQLPAIGTSSFHQSSSTVQTEPQAKLSNESNDVAFVSSKFQLQYTCKVCDTRNHHLVSRIGKWPYKNDETLSQACTQNDAWIIFVISFIVRSLHRRCRHRDLQGVRFQAHDCW